jgi:uncharacterized membrane protein
MLRIKREEAARRRRDKPWYLFYPNDRVVLVRDVLSMLALVGVFVIVPFEVAFIAAPMFGVMTDPLWITNRVFDVVFVLDLVLEFFVAQPKAKLIDELESAADNVSENPDHENKQSEETDAILGASQYEFKLSRIALAYARGCKSRAQSGGGAGAPSSPRTAAPLSPCGCALLDRPPPQSHESRPRSLTCTACAPLSMCVLLSLSLSSGLTLDVLGLLPSVIEVAMAIDIESSRGAMLGSEAASGGDDTDSVLPLLRADKTVKMIKIMRIARLTKMLRLLQLSKLLRCIQPDGLLADVADRVHTLLIDHTRKMRIFRLIFLIFVVTHLMACFLGISTVRAPHSQDPPLPPRRCLAGRV